MRTMLYVLGLLVAKITVCLGNDPGEKPHDVVSPGDCRFPTERIPYVVAEP
jgi:hypothetical protein